jgi:hypothetical protein
MRNLKSGARLEKAAIGEAPGSPAHVTAPVRFDCMTGKRI